MTTIQSKLNQLSNYSLNENLVHFSWAGDLDIVKYLLTSPDLKEHADINFNNDEPFREACYYGHLDLVKYLLTSPDLKKHSNIFAVHESGFRLACDAKKIDVVSFLIKEMCIPKTNSICSYLNKNPNMYIENLFILREINHNLEKDLSSDKIKIKKIKL